VGKWRKLITRQLSRLALKIVVGARQGSRGKITNYQLSTTNYPLSTIHYQLLKPFTYPEVNAAIAIIAHTVVYTNWSQW
jgi:hypothetical protein